MMALSSHACIILLFILFLNMFEEHLSNKSINLLKPDQTTCDGYFVRLVEYNNMGLGICYTLSMRDLYCICIIGCKDN